MSYGAEDRLRDVERDIRELKDQTRRLPIRLAIAAAGGGGSVAIIVQGLAGSDAVMSQYTISLSEATVMQGTIPDDITEITCVDTMQWDIKDGQYVWVMLAAGKEVGEDLFQTFQAGCPPEEE